MADQQLYFLAIVPPSPIYEEVSAMKRLVSDRFNSKGALRSPPHITLHMPFGWRSDREDKLINLLSDFNPSVDRLEVTLKNFNWFEPRVIYVDVLPNDDLRRIQHELVRYVRKNLGLINADYKERGFHPHMTIAFRDLNKAMFLEAREYFKHETYDATFIAHDFALLRHNVQHWDILRLFEL